MQKYWITFLLVPSFVSSAQVENVYINTEFPNSVSDHDPVLLRIDV